MSCDACDRCGKESKVSFLGGEDSGYRRICLDCFNRLMADEYAVVMPENVPEVLTFKGRGKKTHVFEIQFMIVGTGKSLTATEIGETKRIVDVWGDLDDDFEAMMKTLDKRIRKSLHVRYVDAKGIFKSQKAVGYISYNSVREDHDVIIDGKPFTWEELGKNISCYEGWKIKIEFGDIGADFQ